MDWIFDNFQILALVGLAAASWFKTRMDAKAAEREAQREREEEGDQAPEESWQEMSKIPEAPQPPPLMERRPPPLVISSPPPMTAVLPNFETDAELKRQVDLQERLRQARADKAVTTGGAAVTRARNTAKTTTQLAITSQASLRSMLFDRRMLRRAFVLREVLGPPLAMRADDPKGK